MATMQDALEVDEISQQIYDLLAGRGAAVQGAVCADLLSRWLAGHIVLDNEEATAEAREEILDAHIRAVRKLIPIHEREILAEHGQRKQ